ncbi:V-type ATP synthase subunit I [Chloroflexota bacterium]
MKIPLIVSTPESMTKVRVITLKDYLEQTVKVLHRIGVLHIETSEELEPLDRAALEGERNEVSELLTRVDDALNLLPEKGQVLRGENIGVIYTRPFSELRSEVVSLCTKLNNQYHRIVNQETTIKHLTELHTYLAPFAQQADLRLRDMNFSGNYLFSRLFVLPGEAYEHLQDRLESHLFKSVSNTIGNETIVYALGKVGNQKNIESLVSQAEGRVIQIPDEDLTLPEFFKVTEGRIRELEQELVKLREELQSQIRDNLEKLILMKAALLAESERLSVLEKASEARYVTLIEGWIPESKVETAIAELKYDIDYLFIDTRKPEPSEEPPSKQKNPAGLKPFQVITNLFGIPRYKEWDPTPIIAYSFALFFGTMLGDVVYAIGVLLLARFLLPMFTDNPESENFKLFQRVFYISGSAALIIGLLSGTYLGDLPSKFFGFGSLAIVKGVEDIFKSPILFILSAIAIGLVHVNLGHIIGLIRGVKEGNKGTVLSRIGLFTLQLSALPYLMHNMFGVNIPLLNEQIYSILMYILLLSVMLIIAASIIERGKFIGSIFWLFDMTGILGDVMSYARLAGVGLATYYLAFAFNLMAGLFMEAIPGIIGMILGVIIAVLILIVGHMVNLVLGVLTGFIHSLRLCFVEFLLKFYEGGGREYNPFKLKTQASIVVGTRYQ